MNNLFEDNGANFSECRKYRFLLWRKWDENKSPVLFIGLNPSTANETEPDPTITRVIGFAKTWGFGGIYMMNLFPYVTTKPKLLIDCEPSFIEQNDYILSQIGPKCAKIVFAWGNFKQVGQRSKVICKMFPNGEVLVVNKNGSPRHPLYVKGNVTPIRYLEEGEGK